MIIYVDLSPVSQHFLLSELLNLLKIILASFLNAHWLINNLVIYL